MKLLHNILVSLAIGGAALQSLAAPRCGCCQQAAGHKAQALDSSAATRSCCSRRENVQEQHDVRGDLPAAQSGENACRCQVKPATVAAAPQAPVQAPTVGHDAFARLPRDASTVSLRAAGDSLAAHSLPPSASLSVLHCRFLL